MRKLIGHVSVDAGIIWIGDPCYILHKEKDELDEDLGKTWQEFCEVLEKKMEESKNDTAEFKSGVCASSGYGDGEYPVYAEIDSKGIIKSLTIKFDEE